MRQPRRSAILTSLLAALMAPAMWSNAAVAQSVTEPYPNRPVKLVVSYAAGNIADVLARSVAQKLAEHWKQPVVVENRPGQGGSLGAQVVSKAAPDGYTLLFSAMAAIAINPHVYTRVGYDPIADFVPITAVARTSAGILYAGLDVKANTFAELLALSKAQPGTLNYGTAGSGTVPHLNMEALKGLTGLDATHVPYKAAAAVLTDVVGGRIQIAQESSAVVLPQLRAGKIKAIAITGTERIRELKDVPALSEIVPQFDPVQPWMGVLAPAGTPPARVAQIHAAMTSILNQSDLQERIAGLNLRLLGLDPATFARTVRADLDRFGVMVKALKLQAD
jgi:tripartite-type tricarboxylate transporter receptor subunit TctC